MLSIKYIISIFVFFLTVGEIAYFYISSSKTLSANIEKEHMDFMRKSMLSYQESIEYFIRDDNFEKIREDITSLGFDEKLIEAILINVKGIVDASIHLEHVGERLEDELEHNRDIIGSIGINYIKDDIYLDNKSHKLNIFNDRTNHKLIGTCPINYGISSTNSYLNRNGILIMIRDTSGINVEVNEILQKQLFPLIIFMIFISILFGLILHLYITKRINTLELKGRLYSKDNHDVDFTVGGNDEITKLGQTFNLMVKDIELQNRLIKEKEKHLELTLDSIGDAVIATDTLGNITRINPTALRLTGYTYGDAIGSSIYDVFNIYNSETNRTEENPVKKVLRLGIVVGLANHTVLKSKNNIEHQISDSGAPIVNEDGKTVGVILVFRDVTQEYKTQKELNKYRNELETIVSSRTKELNKAQEQLVESEKMASLGSLVSGIAHEINTPVGLSLTGITHIKELTNNIIKELENQTLKHSSLSEYLKDVSSMSTSMNKSLIDAAQLIKSFKRISVDQHGEQIRKFNLHSYVNDILFSLKNEIKHTHIEITNSVDIGLNLNSYPGIFSQVLTNLIINSKIHAFDEDENGAIIISTKIEDEKLSLIYEDNGKGMTQKVIKHIFDPFFTTKMGQGGSGLGMHIIYNLVTQKLRGTIKCYSALEKGTKFIINIPIEE